MTGSSALCSAPGEEGRDIRVPAQACDTHAHVIAADFQRFPLVEDRSYTPVPAPENEYLSLLDRLGMARGVLVQPSIYGTDNRYLLQVLQRHPSRLRGVAVVDSTFSEQQLWAMHELGVRGVRINLAFRGGVSLDELEGLAAKVMKLGWHIQLLLDGRQLPHLLPRFTKLSCRFVLDHFAYIPAAEGKRSAAFHALLYWMANFDVWVKLSAPYRLSPLPQDERITEMAQGLLAVAPERLLWGSDWPHVAVERLPDALVLRDRLGSWVPDAGLRHDIFVFNPARLYEF